MESLTKTVSDATVYLGRSPSTAPIATSARTNCSTAAPPAIPRRAPRCRSGERRGHAQGVSGNRLPTVSPLQPVFIHHTGHLLAMDPILPPDRCVIEVLEDVAAPDPGNSPAPLRRLKSLHYRIALDDFVYSQSSP